MIQHFSSIQPVNDLNISAAVRVSTTKILAVFSLSTIQHFSGIQLVNDPTFQQQSACERFGKHVPEIVI
jgi:hypothetical protein